MCMLGIDLVVSHTGDYSLRVDDEEKEEQILNVYASGFRNAAGSERGSLWDQSSEDCCCNSQHSIDAQVKGIR